MKILVVDDEKTLVKGIKFNLENEGYQVECAYDGAAAVDLARNEKFDLLILDVNLPDGSGLKLLEQVRKTSHVPVILLTANDLEMDVVTGLESGADDYITKPFSLAILRARVNAQLRRSIPVKTSCIEIGRFQFDFDRMERWSEDGTEQDRTEAAANPHRKPGANPVPWDAGGQNLDGRRRIRGRKCPVRHRQAAAQQAGGHTFQPPIFENGVRHRVYLGGEVI